MCKIEYEKSRRNRTFIGGMFQPTDNPTDIESRGGSADQLSELWWNGPTWLQHKDEWPENVVTSPSPESEFEAKKVQEVLAVAVQPRDKLDQVMEKHEFWKAVQITT